MLIICLFWPNWSLSINTVQNITFLISQPNGSSLLRSCESHHSNRILGRVSSLVLHFFVNLFFVANFLDFAHMVHLGCAPEGTRYWTHDCGKCISRTFFLWPVFTCWASSLSGFISDIPACVLFHLSGLYKLEIWNNKAYFHFWALWRCRGWVCLCGIDLSLSGST